MVGAVDPEARTARIDITAVYDGQTVLGRPRATVALMALGLLAAMVAVAVFYRGAPLALIRGPPRGVGEVLTGRVLLTRLCIARR